MKIMIIDYFGSLSKVIGKILKKEFSDAIMVETEAELNEMKKTKIGSLIRKFVVEDPDCVIMTSNPFGCDAYDDLKKNADEKVIFLRIGTYVNSRPRNENDYIDGFSEEFTAEFVINYIKEKLR